MRSLDVYTDGLRAYCRRVSYAHLATSACSPVLAIYERSAPCYLGLFAGLVGSLLGVLAQVKKSTKKKVAGSLAVCEGKGAPNRGNLLSSSCDFSTGVQVPFICAKHGQKDGSQLGLTEEF